jgi:putative two-component system response regulator
VNECKEHRKTVLVVDDSPDNIVLLSSILRGEYRVKAALEGQAALELASSTEPPDLILLDIIMPGLNGFDTCAKLKADTAIKDIPVIFLTSRTEEEDERRGFEVGAVDFISRPISPHIVRARIATHLQLKAARDSLADRSAWLEQEVARRVRENKALQDVTMVALGSLAETRNNETGNHIMRTKSYIAELSNVLRSKPDYEAYFKDGSIELIIKSAPLHDIGKVGIPDNILLKPGKLTDDEFEIMKTHTTLGKEAIEKAESLVEIDTSFLRFAREMAYTHHERWDGKGYPCGLAGADIPLSGRLMAIADVYDALISKRVYKEAMSFAEATKIIIGEAGSHFDPELVKAFELIIDKFESIAKNWSDAG